MRCEGKCAPLPGSGMIVPPSACAPGAYAVVDAAGVCIGAERSRSVVRRSCCMRRCSRRSVCSFALSCWSAAILDAAASSPGCGSACRRPCTTSCSSACCCCCACSWSESCLCSSICSRSVVSWASRFWCNASGLLPTGEASWDAPSGLPAAPRLDGQPCIRTAEEARDGATASAAAGSRGEQAASDDESKEAVEETRDREAVEEDRATEPELPRLCTRGALAGRASPSPASAERLFIMQRYFWRCDLMFALVRPSTSISLRMDFGLALSRPSVLHAASNCACSSGVQTKRGRLWWCSSGAGGGVSGGERAVAWIGMLL
mmetsp:Transcript_40881/g.131945  ORF Transcript_40881/g.131945 Transcript_40881/m.131945 type:complete len:319 (-) Transcript_40881:233-1189(-)